MLFDGADRIREPVKLRTTAEMDREREREPGLGAEVFPDFLDFLVRLRTMRSQHQRELRSAARTLEKRGLPCSGRSRGVASSGWINKRPVGL